MEPVVALLKRLQLHPGIDHFTIAILIIGVLADLVGSLLPARSWIRYMALTLMIIGAFFAVGSKITGGWEADRVWKSVTGPGKAVLERHAKLGDILAYVFVILAIWRILVEGLGFVRGTRPIYLIVAVIAVCFLGYQGYLGGQMVFHYGIGTALLAAAPQSSVAGTAAAAESSVAPPKAATPLPTVYVPTPAPTPSPESSPPTPAPPTPEPPTPKPSAVPGTPVNAPGPPVSPHGGN